MEIFISSDGRQKMFIDSVLCVAEEKRIILQSLGIDLVPIFPPRNIGCDSGDILERVLRIEGASLVFMNVTPIATSEEMPVINSGVCVEYGILLGIRRLEKCHLFCSKEYDRSEVSPLFHGRHIDSFRTDHQDNLKVLLNDYIDKYLARSTSEFEKRIQESSRTR